jgi:tetratricopeptide (TPR) repeat protein
MLVPGAAGRAVITDFGLARPFDTAVPAGMTQTGQLIGSPQYMAPEQFLGNGFTASADIYTFGLIVFETIAGQRPFPDENIVRAAIRRTSVDAPPISSVSSEVPASWDRILGRALSRDPAERPALAADIVRDLERAGPYSRAPSRRTLIFTAAGASAVASFAVFLRFNPWRDVQPPAAPIIMFADATPPGPEGETAAGLITLLQKQLDRSPISVLSRGRIEQAWRRMHSDGLALPAVLQSRDAREVALRAGANLVAFTGATRRLDEWTFWLRVEMLGPTPAAPLTYWEKDFKTAVEGDRFTVSTKAADWLAKIAGASHGPEAGRVRTPQELTTSNWEALVEYSDADDAWAHNESDAAVRHLKTALDLDPEFALAAGRMADILTSLGRIDEGLQYYGSAAELVRSKNLTDRESLRIRGIYALDTAQWNTGEEVFSRWIIEYPKDPVPLIYKAVALERLGRIEQSLHVLDMAVALRPGYNSSLSCRALMLLRAGRFDDAARDLAALAKLGPLNLAGQIGGALAFARLDLAGAWQALDDMSRRGDASSQSSAFALKACFRAEQGRPPDAATLLNDGIRFDREHGLAAGELTKRRLLAQLSIATGRLDDARKLCRQVLDTRPGHAVAMEFGSLLARAGDLPGARAALPQNLPDLPVYGYWAARLRAEIALASDDARKATDLLIAAPDNPTSGIWPEYLVRAAHAAGAHAVVKQWVNALAANPAGYWFAADGTGPGFICWALQKFDSEIDSDLQPRAAALRQALSQFK